MTVNEQTRSRVTSHMPLETPHTLHSLPSTKAIDQSQTFSLISNTFTEAEVGNHGEKYFTPNCLIIYVKIILNL